ncbi:MAG: RecQ family ATP-dependent DNA helicase [Bdellovibrionales bacterium]
MSELLKALQKNFALSEFRTGQQEIINSVLNKKDVLAVLPTGGGKSLCYQLPAVQTERLVVVISPLIALMKDQVMSLRRLGLRAGCLHSGQPDHEKLEIFREIQKGGAYVLYLSPERAHKPGFKTWIQNRPVTLFAIDEAHCVSQWGHDFREEYTQLHELKKLRPDVPMLALTASATPLVLDDIARNLALKNPERRVHGFYRSNLYYQVEVCLDEDDKLTYVLESLKVTPKGRILIYCGTRKQAEYLGDLLGRYYAGVAFYHAGMAPEDRTRIQQQYAEGKLRILAATNAFGMGIDQPDVRLVVHYQLPANIDSLYQEMGRAGRDGHPSTCLLLYSKADKGLQNFFIINSKAPQPIKDTRWRNLEALVSYAEGGECRHAEILAYYKDAQRLKVCGHCDTCDPSSNRRVPQPIKEVVPSNREESFFKRAGKSRKTRKASAKAASTNVILDDAQIVRFQLLKAWRLQKANELDLPAFVIFSDKTLRDLAIKNPSNLEQLKNVYGLGETKVERFGWDILAELGVGR